ncbi:MAG: ABC transporter substrate-binding protein [Candidatus Heimdallarchaeota archaeon]|nr:ABC transporter substrate-binding protein [Candidatus Heimdallarchaeota archaeon]
MKKSLMISIGMLIVLSSFVVSTPAVAVEPKAIVDVKVGLLSPQTGGLSAYTKGFEQAALLAIEEINADAAFNTEWLFSLTTYDTQTDPTASSTAMTSAVTAGMHFVVGAAGSSNTLAAAAVAVANTVPLISYASTSPALSVYDDHKVGGDEGYLWRTPPSDALQGQVIADLAYDAGFRDMLIVTLDNAYGSGLANSTKNEFATLGGTSTTITYPELTIDPTSLVTQIAADEPDVVVAISYATDGSLLFTAMAEQKLGIPVIGADGVADVGIFAEDADTADAMQAYLTTKPVGVASAEATAFAAAYAARFTNTSGDIYTGETYDAVYAGAFAVDAAASTAGADIITALAALTFNGATGTLTFDTNGDSSAGTYQISEVGGNNMFKVGNWDPIDGLVFLESGFLAGWNTRNTVTATDPLTVTDTETDTETETGTVTSTSVSTESPFPFMSFVFAVAIFSAVKFMRRRKN